MTKERIELIGKGIALAALLFTASAYIIDLIRENNLRDFQQVQEYVDQYEVMSIDQKVLLFRVSLLPYTRRIDINSEALVPDDRFQLIAESFLFGTNTISEEVNVRFMSFVTILDFYSSLYNCIDQRICSNAISESFFCPRAVEFDQLFGRMIDYVGNVIGHNTFNDGFSQFVAMCRSSAD
ncbi:MAG: hypothetical protein AAF362_18340 [Pseudomonadota bacterium]